MEGRTHTASGVEALFRKTSRGGGGGSRPKTIEYSRDDVRCFSRRNISNTIHAMKNEHILQWAYASAYQEAGVTLIEPPQDLKGMFINIQGTVGQKDKAPGAKERRDEKQQQDEERQQRKERLEERQYQQLDRLVDMQTQQQMGSIFSKLLASFESSYPPQRWPSPAPSAYAPHSASQLPPAHQQPHTYQQP